MYHHERPLLCTGQCQSQRLGEGGGHCHGEGLCADLTPQGGVHHWHNILGHVLQRSTELSVHVVSLVDRTINYKLLVCFPDVFLLSHEWQSRFQLDSECLLPARFVRMLILCGPRTTNCF